MSKDEVALAALRLIDETGLPDFTMRRLAGVLGVQASAIYWHYPNKQTLLAEVSDRIVAAAPRVADGSSWSVRLRGEARALRDALLASRDGAEIVSSTLALGLGSDLATRKLTAALDASPFDPDATRQAAATMLHFILGHVSMEQQRLLYDSVGAREGSPLMLQDVDESEGFCFGVDTIIGGLEARAPVTGVVTEAGGGHTDVGPGSS